MCISTRKCILFSYKQLSFDDFVPMKQVRSEKPLHTAPGLEERDFWQCAKFISFLEFKVTTLFLLQQDREISWCPERKTDSIHEPTRFEHSLPRRREESFFQAFRTVKLMLGGKAKKSALCTQFLLHRNLITKIVA